MKRGPHFGRCARRFVPTPFCSYCKVADARSTSAQLQVQTRASESSWFCFASLKDNLLSHRRDLDNLKAEFTANSRRYFKLPRNYKETGTQEFSCAACMPDQNELGNFSFVWVLALPLSAWLLWIWDFTLASVLPLEGCNEISLESELPWEVLFSKENKQPCKDSLT